jgi:hypothetical protein
VGCAGESEQGAVRLLRLMDSREHPLPLIDEQQHGVLWRSLA